MLNICEELNKFSLIDIAMLENDRSISSNIRSSYELYNKAIQNLRDGNEDIAMIELKKALSLNSNFNDAANLLGLCYYISKEYLLASKIFQAVTEIEKNGIMAQKYLEAITQVEDNTKKGTRILGDVILSIKDVFKNIYFAGVRFCKEKKLLRLGVKSIVGILVVIFVSISIKGILGLRIHTDSSDNTVYSEVPLVVGEGNPNKNVQVDEHLDISNEQNRDLVDLNPVVIDVERLYSNGKLEQAADKLVELRTISLLDSSKTKYDKLANEIFPKAGEKMFADGFQLYLNGRYTESIKKFSKVDMYNFPIKNLDNMYYLLGKAYRETGDYVNAINTFTKVIALFPDSQYAEWAKLRVNELLLGQP